MQVTGGCRCGAVTYEIVGEPKFQVHCQCLECQKLTGTGHASIMIFPKDSVAVSGELNRYTYQADSGAEVTNHFCGECGTPLYNENTKYAGARYMLVGSMDDPSVFEPQRIVYANRGQKWDHMDPDLPRVEAMPTKR